MTYYYHKFYLLYENELAIFNSYVIYILICVIVNFYKDILYILGVRIKKNKIYYFDTTKPSNTDKTQ